MESHKGILKNTCQPKDTHKLKWDENKLKETEKLKEQVTMKVDEPNTPYVRYNSDLDEVTNWQDLPENIRAAHEEPEDFCLDDDDMGGQSVNKISFARKRHEEFERKRAQHYGHTADIVFHPKE
ncbi:hypothetical protein INT47_011028 [Mucor saturninus]|uniref:Protein phosphatase inhibitor 2 n=1 Tax=Mucor saturninus TaxID=64648 RepID=A0A8H7RFS2_9FUNG|nr:hypothetical protein INT47_011028 [Mucor saturninus]